MNQSLIFFLSLTIVLSISCKSKINDDIFSIEYAKKMQNSFSGETNAEALNSRALILYKQKKFLEAAAVYKNALKLYADGDIYFNFGDTLFNLSRFEDAGKAYVISTELGYKKPQMAYYNAACSYSKLKNKKLGLKYLGLAIKHGYNALEYIKKDTDLAFLRSQVNIEEFISQHRFNRDDNNQNRLYRDDNNNELIIAVKQENLNRIRELLEQGANINSIDIRGEYYSSLGIAIQKNNIKIIKYLLDKGIDVNQTNTMGMSPLILAVKQKNNDVEIVKLLLQRNVNINQIPNYGLTALGEAVYLRKIGIARLLIKAGADVNSRYGSTVGYGDITLLMIAVKNNDINLVKLLVSANAKINDTALEALSSSRTGTTTMKVTALSIAKSYGYKKIVDFLISAGARE